MDEKTAAYIAEYDRDWTEWQKSHAGSSFAEFALSRVLVGLRNGRSHPKLGPSLTKNRVWEEDGQRDFATLSKHHPFIRPDDKVLEYGCGTLRLGVHFIQSQNSKRYFGLDISDELLEYGRKLTAHHEAEKSPTVAAIGQGMDGAIEFAADIVLSMNVMHQVHPDETSSFCQNLRQLAHKRRSIVILHVTTSEQPVRYSRGGWAWPKGYFDDLMAPFLRTKSTRISRTKRDDQELEGWLLTYVPR